MNLDQPHSLTAVDLDRRIPVEELCARYEGVFTAAVNDVLRALGLLQQTLPHTLRPIRGDMRVAGVAFTIRGERDATLEDEMEERAEMLEAIGTNTVCLWETGGDDETAQWGEVMTMAALQRGCRGAVVDGGVRDTEQVLGLGFPVFARFHSSNGMLGRFRLKAWQEPIEIGGVRIEPGDIVFGDLDGVIVVPARLALFVLERAEKIRDKEIDIKQLVADGLPPREVVARGGYF